MSEPRPSPRLGYWVGQLMAWNSRGGDAAEAQGIVRELTAEVARTAARAAIQLVHDADSEAESSLRARLVAEVENHWPDIAGDIDDSTWLVCSCGWDSSKKGADDWVTHVLAVIKGQEPPRA